MTKEEMEKIIQESLEMLDKVNNHRKTIQCKIVNEDKNKPVKEPPPRCEFCNG